MLARGPDRRKGTHDLAGDVRNPAYRAGFGKKSVPNTAISVSLIGSDHDGSMRIILILSLLTLAACSSPAPQFMGAPRHDLELEGIRFTVFTRENEAEVIRLGYLSRRERAGVPELMLRAAEQASGCRAIPGSMRTRSPGDTGEARVGLDC